MSIPCCGLGNGFDGRRAGLAAGRRCDWFGWGDQLKIDDSSELAGVEIRLLFNMTY